MSLLKSKQLDMTDLIISMGNSILANPSYKALWASILNNTFNSTVFSIANSNITYAQTAFTITFSTNPIEVIVYRNGNKLINLVDYTKTNGIENFTITLTDPIGASSGGDLSEIIEINYY